MVDWMDRKTDEDRYKDRYLNRELEREQFTHFYLVNFWTVFDGFRSAGKLKHEGDNLNFQTMYTISNRCKWLTVKDADRRESQLPRNLPRFLEMVILSGVCHALKIHFGINDSLTCIPCGTNHNSF